jgi:hypothetical protein
VANSVDNVGNVDNVDMIKKLDQQRHELKALRYLLEYHPQSLQSLKDSGALPSRDDFQILDCQLMYDVILAAKTKEDAAVAIEELDLEDTEVESFLSLGGQFYHSYPALVKERGQEFRDGKMQLINPGGED